MCCDGVDARAADTHTHTHTHTPHPTSAHIYTNNKLKHQKKRTHTGRELDPYDGRAYIGLARIELRRRNSSAARAIYEDALRFCADNPFVLQAYGVFQQKQGDLRRAMDLYDMAIKHGPKHSAAWLAKAQLLWELGRKREARECFQVRFLMSGVRVHIVFGWSL